MRLDAPSEDDECPQLYEKVKSHPVHNFHPSAPLIQQETKKETRKMNFNFSVVLLLVLGLLRPVHPLNASNVPNQSDLLITRTTAITDHPEVNDITPTPDVRDLLLVPEVNDLIYSLPPTKSPKTQSEVYFFKDQVEEWASSILVNKNLSSKPANRRSSRSVCRISEFSCGKGKCISSSKYCDGIDDCQDGLASDEPLRCTPCNRTYYGEWGSTYSISLSSDSMAGGNGYHHPLHQASPPSKFTKIPTHFVCQLTFAAAGDDFGDLVQIMFDSINIGHLSSPTLDGCPDGSLQVAEISRPITGGQWCGFGTGYSVYYSEMSAVALTLSIGGFALENSGHAIGGSRSGNDSINRGSSGEQNIRTTTKGDKTVISGSSSQQPIEFDFKIRYKFIPRGLAIVRYGMAGSSIERGELVPGTYCSRVLDTCHQKPCKIQTPNYPGLYPRNVSCFFTIRQREIPTCKRVLIQVSQLKPHKVQLRSIPGRLAGSISGISAEVTTHSDSFLSWDECTGSTDSLIIYDGTTTDDPILIKICGGSTIPPITSSGPEVLVAFHSTPYGNPLESKPPPPFPMPLRGFELDVDVIIVDSLSADYSNRNSNCTFYFISEKGNDGGGGEYKAQEFGGNWIARKYGTVSSPRHTLPPRSTCRYEFRGSKYENVWIYFIAYRRDVLKDSKESGGNCTTRLRILDGLDMRNEVLLGSYCDADLPRLCDHKALANDTRDVRACTINESYISAGSRLIVEQQFQQGTALRPLHYQFHYEFVTRHVGNDGTCHRHYSTSKMKKRGTFRTTDNVFDFGRGGKTNISCIYSITLAPFESLHLTLVNSSFGDRGCRTVTDLETGRYACQYPHVAGQLGTSSLGQNYRPFHSKSEIQLYEYIWANSNLTAHNHCICGNTSGQQFTFLGRKVEFVFSVENMRNEDSHETFFALFNYAVNIGGCHSDNHFLRTEAGLISLESTFLHGARAPSCEYYPWLIEATEAHSLYLRIPGSPMLDERRHTPSMTFSRNRSLTPVTPTGTLEIPRTVDPPRFPFYPPERLCATTKNRIFVYNQDGQLVQKICPASTHQITSRLPSQTVEIYSEDFSKFASPLYPPPKIQFVIEFVGRELGTYRIHWLEVMSIKMKAAVQALEKESTRIGAAAHAAAANFNRTGGFDKKDIFSPFDDPFFQSMFENGNDVGGTGIDTENSHLVGPSAKPVPPTYAEVCKYFCPELQACISEKLWCNGIVDCPVSLQDEKSCDSFWLTLNQLMSPAVYLPIAAAITSALVCCLLVLVCIGLRRLCLGSRKRNGGGSSRTSTLDTRRRLPPSKDLFIDPHDPDS